MTTIQHSGPSSTRERVENLVMAGVGIVLAAGAAVTLTLCGMFAAVIWLH